MFDPATLPGEDDPVMKRAQKFSRSLRLYHRHRVIGMEHVPRSGRVLLVVNHSLATYDIALLVDAIWTATGRIPRGLADHSLFRGVDQGRIVSALGFVEGNPGNGEALLEHGAIAVVAPGGMREALRPSHERYSVLWDRRKGFIRLAMKTGSPIVLAACPDADRVYKIYENRLTKLVYQQARLPLPVFRGWGPTLWPRPVALTHLLSEPLIPPGDDPTDDAAVDAWHAELTTRMNTLMSTARDLPREGLRGGWRPSRVLG